MASNKDIPVEKDKVPKMTSHFETLSTNSKDNKDPSLEEITAFRSQAQQNSIDAIRSAEERSQGGKNVISSLKDTVIGKIQEPLGPGEDAISSKGEDLKYRGADHDEQAPGVVGKVKDQAAATGWKAAEFTMGKLSEATKTVAGVTSSVVGYSEEKAVAAKDKVAGAGKAVAGYGGEKVAALKDAVVEAEEKVAAYAESKKVETEKEIEEKKSSAEKVGARVGEEGGERVQKIKGEGGVGREGGERAAAVEKLEGGGGSVLGAIGETIVEIGQTTKELLTGKKDKEEEQRRR